MDLSSLFLYPLAAEHTNNRGTTRYRCLKPGCPVDFQVNGTTVLASLPEHHHRAAQSPRLPASLQILAEDLRDQPPTRDQLHQLLRLHFLNENGETRWSEFFAFAAHLTISEGVWHHEHRPNEDPKKYRLHQWRECAIAHSTHFKMVKKEEVPSNSFWCPECHNLNAEQFHPIFVWKLWYVMTQIKVPQEAFGQAVARRNSDARLLASGRRDHRGSQKAEIPFFVEFLNECRQLEGLKPVDLKRIDSTSSNRYSYRKAYNSYRERLNNGSYPSEFARRWSEKFAALSPPEKRARRI